MYTRLRIKEIGNSKKKKREKLNKRNRCVMKKKKKKDGGLEGNIKVEGEVFLLFFSSFNFWINLFRKNGLVGEYPIL